MRGLVISLALACAGAQLAPGSALLAGLLTHAIHRGDHAHAVALVAEQGHLHRVLSHDDRGDHSHAGAPQHDGRPPSPSGTDHVFHITSEDAAGTSPRRADVWPAAMIAVEVAALAAPVPLWVPTPSPDPRAHSADSLRSVVLRL